MTHTDWILYILFFIGAFMLVLALATAYTRAGKRYNKTTREYK